MGGLFNGKRLKRTVVCHMPMLITNRADPGRTEAGGMSPSTTKVALESETRGLGMSRGGDMTVRADVVGAVFTVMTQTMTPKAFGEGGGGSTGNRDLNKSGGGRNDLGSIG